MTPGLTLSEAVSEFGAAAKATLGNPAIAGEPEEQLRGPLVALIKAIAPLTGLAARDTETDRRNQACRADGAA